MQVPDLPGWREQAQGVRQIPNYDRLTRGERWVMDRLPGFAESSVGKALAAFGDSWAGKLLSYLDVPAEGLERATGLAAQYLLTVGDEAASKDFRENLNSAWYAGSLASDMANLPRLQDGRWFIPDDLPGLPGVIRSRQEIARLTAQGMAPGDALIRVRDQFYEDQGALALRSQLQDTYFHVLADPLSVILPFLKPVERIAIKRRALLIRPVVGAIPEATETVGRIGNVLQNLEDVVRGAGADVEAATARIVEQAAGNETLLQDAQRVLDLVRTKAAPAAIEEAMDVLRGSRSAIEASIKNPLKPWEESFLRWTGGLPGEAPKKLPFPLNAFQLTPRARAYEFMNVMLDNVGAYLFGKKFDPDQIVRALGRAADGMLGKQFGHMIVTPEGRTLRAALGGARARAVALLGGYKQVANERDLLNLVARVTGEKPAGLIGRLTAKGNEEVAIFAQFSEKLAQLPDAADIQAKLALLLKNMGLPDFKPESLRAIGEIFKDNLLWSVEGFQHELLGTIIEHVGQQAVLQFGLKHSGVISQVASAMKAAETLAFLKMNPSYPIRNGVNNLFTSIARDVFNIMPTSQMELIWKRVGGEPARLRAGVGAAGIITETGVAGEKAASEALSAGAQILHDAERGKVGWLNSVMNWANEQKGLGFGDVAQRFESKASFRAFTSSYIKAWRQYWREGVAYQILGDWNPGLAKAIDAIDPTIGPTISNVLRNALSEAEIDGGLLSDNLRLTVGNIVAEAEQRSGMQIGKVLTDEFMATIEPELQEAVKAGRQSTIEWFDNLGGRIEKALDDALDEAFKTIRDETAARVEAEGPGSFVHLMGDSMDEHWGTSQKHATEIGPLVASIRANEDAAIQHGLWRQFRDGSERFHNRSWQRLEARFEGWSQAAKKLGLPYADEVMSNVRSWRDGWRQFFDFRKTALDDFFQARLEGRSPHRSFEQILDDIDAKYVAAVNREDRYVNTVDRTVAQMLPQNQRRAFLTWRERVAGFRRSDKDLMIAFRKQVRTLSPSLQEEAWKNLWPQRVQNFIRIRQEEKAGSAALQGSRQAQAYYQGAVAEIEEGLALLNRQVAGETLSDQEKLGVQDFIARHRFPEETDRLRRLSEAENVAGGNLTIRQFLGARGVDDVTQIARVPVNDLPLPVRQQLISTIENWYQQISTGDPAYKVFDTSAPGLLDDPVKHGALLPGVTEEGGIPVTGVGSGYPSWYGKILKEFNTDKKAVLTALDRIRNGDDTRGIRTMIERFKNLAYDEIVAGPEIADVRYPPDPAILRFFERPPDEIQAAIDLWKTEHGVDIEDFNRAARATEQARIRDAVVRRLTIETHYRITGPGGFSEVLTESAVQRRIEEIGRFLDEVTKPGSRKPTDVVRVGEGDNVREFTRAEAEARRLAYSEVGPSPKKRVVFQGERTTIEDLQRRLTGYEAVLKPAPVAEGSPVPPKDYLPDFHSFVERQLVDSTGIDQLWYTRGSEAVRAMREAALEQFDKKPLRFDNLPPDLQQGLRGYIDHVKGSMSDARYASTRFAEYGRDSALLNYNRRFNYNTWLGTIMPYEFWMTQSAFKWALHSIDRPAMLTTYLRMKKMLETGYRPEEGLPSRLRGKIRIDLPFLPDWMGDQFVDPMRTALPFDTFAYPFEEAQAQGVRDQGAAERVLREMLNDGKITQADYDQALASKTGSAWERAVMLARQDDTEGRLNGFDFAALFSSPHAPIMWAYNAARGEPERIGPFTPLERSIAGVQGMFGIPPSEGLNSVSAAVRKALGLPAFDQWEDYRVDRMLSNLAATGDITTQDALRAMIDRDGPAFELAQRRAAQEFSVSALGSTIGFPANAYPEGEHQIRSEKEAYEAAWKAYEGGDLEAVNRFYDTYPEYETRLALWKSPEQRLQTFLVDELWNTWFDLPSLHRSEAQEQLGDLFQNAFLNKDTRSYESIPVGTLGVWLKLLGGDPPGSLTPSQGIPPIELAPLEIAKRAQVFYDMRDSYFPEWREQQEAYYRLDEGAARRQYRSNHQDYETYRDWRWDFLTRNPEVAPYLTDEPPTYPSESALNAAVAAQPSFQPQEWRQMMGGSMYALVLDLVMDGDPLPEVASNRLRALAESLGMSTGAIVAQFEASPVMLP